LTASRSKTAITDKDNMVIYINEKPADITLDTEKTLGDVMSGIELWISPSGNRIKNIRLEGKDISTDAISEAFSVNVADIKKLDVFVSPWRELASEALQDLYQTCVLFNKAAFDERKNIAAEWEKSAAARFLMSDIPDLSYLAGLSLTGEGLSASDFSMLIEERLRELASPKEEIDNSAAKVELIAGRLEELPLDMQTGKDQKAAETIQLFTGMSEKLFRILFIFRSEGFSPEAFSIDGLSVKTFVEEFNSTLKELSTAYENRDTVLVGDIAEYELAPRLLKLFSAMKNIKDYR
jgi:hypothetical protein